MCGLVGLAGTVTIGDKDTFDDLLIIDSIRGKDGTGIATVVMGHPDQTYLVKGTGGPEMLQDRMQYHKAVNLDRMFMLGHNRFRTMGDASSKNAHPFEFSNIIGAHNGTLKGKHNFKDGIHFDTDSEAMFNNLNELGLEDTIQKMDGAYAMVWWDKKNHSLNMLRNKERPLYYVVDEAGSTIYWASEAPMLYLALNHNRIKFSGKKVYMLPEDVHMEWVIPLKRDQAIPVQKRTKIKVPTRPFGQGMERSGAGCSAHGAQNRKFPVVVSSTTQSPSNGGGWTQDQLKPGDVVIWDEAKRDFTIKNSNQLPLVPQHPPKQQKDVTELKLSRMLVNTQGVPYYLDTNANIIYEEEFDTITGKGCSNCGAQPVFSEPVKFLKEGGIICVDCMLKESDEVVALVNHM